MRVEVDGRSYEGRAVDLGGALSPETVLRAIREDRTVDDRIAIACPAPGAVHEHVGHVHPGLSLDLRAALASAARSLGFESADESEREAVQADLESIAPQSVDLAAARQRVAETGDREQRLRERVATLRGRVQTLRELGRDAEVSETESNLAAAIERLSKVETERIAARQRLDRLERRANDARDDRERRLQLQDRLGNLERAIRRELAGEIYGRFASAVESVPGEGTAGDRPGEYTGDPVTAALAVVRVAAMDAPVVLATERFERAATAADCLDAHVVGL